jgi:hypothetical protein
MMHGMAAVVRRPPSRHSLIIVHLHHPKGWFFHVSRNINIDECDRYRYSGEQVVLTAHLGEKMGAEEPVRRRHVVPEGEPPAYQPEPAKAPVQPAEPEKVPA